MKNIDIGVKIDLPTLIDTRMLICANSGGGKSYAVRKLLEESHGKVLAIVLDIEGEFHTLREKFDFLLIGGKNGDVDLSIKAAPLLPKKILELNVPTIIDISDLKMHERIQYVKLFLDALMQLPRADWKPCLVILDEVHLLCGQQEKQESYVAVIDLMTRGRKRGYCGVLCTQRIAKLHKDSVAETNNVMIGRTGLDIDMKRSADILGFTSKQDMLSLRDLDAGEFFVFGTAISRKVEKIKIGKVKTTHPHVGMRHDIKVSPPTAKIKSLLSKLSELPKQAEKEQKEKKDLLAEITQLKHELRIKKTDPQQIEKIKSDFDKSLAKEMEVCYRKGLDANVKELRQAQANLKQLQLKLQQIAKILEVPIPKHMLPPKPIAFEGKFKQSIEKHKPLLFKHVDKDYTKPSKSKYTMFDDLKEQGKIVSGNDMKITSGALRMLGWVVASHPNTITIQRVATLSGFSAGGGTFQEYLRVLIRNNLVHRRGDNLNATNEGVNGVEVVPDFPQGQELIDLWSSKLSSGVAKIFRIVCEAYPETITKEEAGERSGFSHTGGTFQEYIRILKRNGLIEIDGDEVKASEELFEG